MAPRALNPQTAPAPVPEPRHTPPAPARSPVLATLRRLLGNWRGRGGYGELLRIAGPLILSNASQSIQHFVDRMFLSWYSPNAIAAAMPASILSFTVVCIFTGIAGYATTFVAQYSGAKQDRMTGPVVWQGSYVAIIGAAVNFALVPLAPSLFAFIGHAPAVQADEVPYFQILCYGAFFSVASAAFSSFFSGRGKVWPIMWINFAVTAVNTVGNYLLIFGKAGFPELGIRGAGIATVIAQGFGFLLYLILFLRRVHEQEYATRSGWRLRWGLFTRLLRFGVPSGVQFFVDVASFTAFVMLVGRIGTEELAATNIAFNINTLAFMPMIGLGVAVSVLVGQYLGEKSPDIAGRSAWNALRIGLTYMGSLSVIYLAFPAFFANLFSPRTGGVAFEDIRNMTIVLLRFVALYSVFDSLNIVFSSVLKGAGDTRFVMTYFMLMAALGLVLPSVLLVGVLGLGLTAAWIVVSAYIILLAVGFLLRFVGAAWKKMLVI